MAERRSKLDGRYLEDLGWLNPLSKEVNIKKERVLYWIEKGAWPTETVHNLLVRENVITGSKKPVHKKKKVEQQNKEIKEEAGKSSD